MQFHLAHGVGRLYESPLPLSLYLVGAAATVLVSFLLRALAKEDRAFPPPRRLIGPGIANGVVVALKVLGVVGLVLTIISGIAINNEGLTFPALLFWVGLIVGGITIQAIVAGTWEAGNPWATLESVYRIEEAEVEQNTPPVWLGPLLVYLLFWFELVSGAGFDSFWIVVVIVVYSIFFFTMRLRWRDRWNEVDPLSILFGFAG